MAYFISGERFPTVEELRQGTGSLSGAETVVFGADGRFFWRIDNPLVGEQFGFLSDVSIADFGEKSIIQDVTLIGQLNLYQVAVNNDGKAQLVSLTYGTPQIDEVLGAQFPTFVNNSGFVKLSVTPGYSGTTYLPEFYLEASGGAGFFDEFYGPYGFDAPNDGRALIVRGSISGQRDTAWGNWLDTVTAGGDVPAPGEYNTINPSTSDFIPPDALLPLPSLKNPSELVSGHIDYEKNSSGSIYFTEEKYEAFQDVSKEYGVNLIDGIQSYVIKKAAIAALSAAYPGAGWVNTVKTTWDVYSVTKPLIEVGMQSFLQKVGFAATAPTDAQIESAFFRAGANVALKLTASSGDTLTGDVYKILTKAGIATYGSIHWQETDSFTYSLFDQVSPQFLGVVIAGGEKRDVAFGSHFADTIRGNGGDDRLLGFTGNDVIEGGLGRDALNGGSGNDRLNGGAGADSMIGGAGSDTYYVENLGDVVTETIASAATGGTDIVFSSLPTYTLRANIEGGRVNTTGSANLTGNSLNNVIYAGAGNNVLDGGPGTDTVSYAYGLVTGARTGVTLDLRLASAQATGGSNSDAIKNFENITGSSLGDKLIGTTGANVIDGGLGADTMLGGAGNDTYYVDRTTDRVFETTTTSSTLNAGGIDKINSSVGFNLAASTAVSFVENLTLTGSAAINGTGNSLHNALNGNSAKNTLNGGGGNDVLNGGGGADTVLGGSGNDTYYVDNTGDKVYETTTTSGTTNAGWHRQGQQLGHVQSCRVHRRLLRREPDAHRNVPRSTAPAIHSPTPLLATARPMCCRGRTATMS